MTGAIIGYTVLVGVSGLVCYWSFKYQQKVWNNGHCSECGEQWKKEELGSTSRTYRCKNGHYCVLSNFNEEYRN